MVCAQRRHQGRSVSVVRRVPTVGAVMPEQDPDFAVLMRGLREGSEDAARQLYSRYGHHVRRVVRRKLNPRIRSKYDSDDFTQAVWASFFACSRDFQAPEALIAFLATVARHKVIEAFRQRMQTLRFGVQREQSLENTPPGAEPAAADPTASQLAAADERWQQMLDGRPTLHQRILGLLREGHTHEEIARRLKISERTVRRLVRRLETVP